jgi:hypothetical protein
MDSSGMTVERDIYDGRTLLGVVRERSDGSFVVVRRFAVTKAMSRTSCLRQSTVKTATIGS